MRKICKIVIILGVIPYSFSQPGNRPYTKNCIYVEMLGQGIICSVNYDYRFTQNISGRLGFTTWRFGFFFGLDLGMTGFPLMLNYLYGKKSHYAELGLGTMVGEIRAGGSKAFFTTSPGHEKETFVLLTSTIGYRYQPMSSGLLLRVGLTPLSNLEDTFLSGGVSIGWAF